MFSGADPDTRYIAVVGDAELDEGSVWEAIAEPAMHGQPNILWVVDLNRQSLDRIIPGIRVRAWREMFDANGWKVIDAKYGKRLQAKFCGTQRRATAAGHRRDVQRGVPEASASAARAAARVAPEDQPLSQGHGSAYLDDGPTTSYRRPSGTSVGTTSPCSARRSRRPSWIPGRTSSSRTR